MSSLSSYLSPLHKTIMRNPPHSNLRQWMPLNGCVDDIALHRKCSTTDGTREGDAWKRVTRIDLVYEDFPRTLCGYRRSYCFLQLPYYLCWHCCWICGRRTQKEDSSLWKTIRGHHRSFVFSEHHLKMMIETSLTYGRCYLYSSTKK